MLNEEDLLDKLDRYEPVYHEQEVTKNRFLSFLCNENAYERSNLEGHITCSCWLINKDGTKAVLLKHKKLNMWLQPGGHADGDKNTLFVAIKEAKEETNIHNIEAVSEDIFDLDIHKIPEHKGVPEHYHYDVRYLLRVTSDEKGFISDESEDILWIDKNNIPLEILNSCHYGLTKLIWKWKKII